MFYMVMIIRCQRDWYMFPSLLISFLLIFYSLISFPFTVSSPFIYFLFSFQFHFLPHVPFYFLFPPLFPQISVSEMS